MFPMRLVVAVIAVAASVACRETAGAQGKSQRAAAAPEAPIVISWEGGEHFQLGRRRAPLSIKVSPRIGSRIC